MRYILLLLLAPWLLMSTSGNPDKFVGKWHPRPNSAVPSTFTLTIKKAGDYYVMLSSEKPDEPIAIKFDSKTKLMSGRLEGMHFTISYSTVTDFILFSPDEGGRVLFQRIK